MANYDSSGNLQTVVASDPNILSQLEIIADVLGQLLVEMKRVRFILQAGALPEVVDELDEAAPISDESDTDESQGV